LNIKDLQKITAEIESIIAKGTSFKYPELLRFLKATEELGEVGDVLLRFLVGSRKGKLGIEKAKEELAMEIVDTIIPLIGIANVYDIDLDAYFEKKFLKDRKRYSKKG